MNVTFRKISQPQTINKIKKMSLKEAAEEKFQQEASEWTKCISKIAKSAKQ
jgi:hypothetical protein